LKKIISFLITLIILVFIYIYRDQITQYVLTEFSYRYSNVTQEANEYKKKLDIAYAKETDNFFPKNRQDIINIVYTSLNNGVDSFIYYCTDEYENCKSDTEKLASDSETLSSINNFVHPYNSYNKLSFKINNYGKVEISVQKQYSKKEIELINKKVDEIYLTITNDRMNTNDKIKAIHDYIINNSAYDKAKAELVTNGSNITNSEFRSETAYGVLLQGNGICGGFSDAMELFLNKMNVTTYKIASETHIWNLIYLDNKWVHLDLTWDNPIVNGDGKLLLHDFYLIETSKLTELNTGHHLYDRQIYIEAQ
jgi:Transglutaminase-like superfamily.